MFFSRLTFFQKLLLSIFTLHLAAFFVFVIKKMTDANFNFNQPGVYFLAALVFLTILIPVFFKRLRKIRILRIAAKYTAKLFFILYTAVLVYLLAGFVINPPITVTQLADLAKGYGLKRDYIGGNQLGRNIKLAVIASEDQLYPDHDGFDVKAIKKAIKYNQRNPNRTRGASTISQQTAKNIFLWQGGGFFRKGLEVFFTFTIETVWPKKLILNRYLNIAEMGPGVFGAEAAANKYFNKNASALTETEAARLAAILPNPKKYNISGNYVNRRANAIRRQMQFLKSDPDVIAITGN